MKQLTRRQLKSHIIGFRKKEGFRKAREARFAHRAPSGDLRKKESVIRLIAENVDQVLIVVSFVLPNLKPGLIDRLLVIAGLEDIVPIIVFNKIDLIEDRSAANEMVNLYRSLGYATFATSAITGEGIDFLKDLVRGKVSALAGHSGVGKTSLLNRIEENLLDKPEEREVSLSTGKGRHATTSIKMYRCADSSVIFDLPGLKYATFHDITPMDVQRFFPEIHSAARSCRFSDCLHVDEPSCAVKSGVDRSIIALPRYESYKRIVGSF